MAGGDQTLRGPSFVSNSEPKSFNAGVSVIYAPRSRPICMLTGAIDYYAMPETTCRFDGV